MSLYEEAWDKLYKRVKQCIIYSPNGDEELAEHVMEICLLEIRQEAEEYRKEQEKEMEEDYKKRWNTEIKEL